MKDSAVERAVVRSVAEYGLIAKGDRIAVAVSGGADSVALCYASYRVSAQYALTLTVCHFNHRLRGAESDRDEQFVREFAGRLGLAFRCGSGDVAEYAAEHGLTPEEAGRTLRYAFLADCAEENGKIATAHTKNDNAETLLLDLARGSGTRGMSGIPRRRGNIIRPLLDCTRAEIEDYLAENELSYVTDSSNASDDYARNRIRHRVVPELTALCPAFAEHAAQLAQRAARDEALLEQLACEARAGIESPQGLDTAGLLALPRPLADRILLALLRESDAPVSARTVEEMRRIAAQGGALEIKKQLYFRAGAGHLWLEKAEPLPQPFHCEAVFPEGEGTLLLHCTPEKTLRLTFCYNSDGNFTQKLHKEVLKNVVDCGTMKNSIFRRRLPGDRLRLRHRGLTKTLKQLCNEAHLSPAERAALVVMESGGQVVWCERFGADEHFLAGTQSRNLLLIEVLEG